ncbi:expressed unknown protein [Seminavis robusta]|uniref:Uncharacterized protein n=1 Tax=Seminavis robusta TaxID=568900 RepID=A0A9N8DXQ5_9STRA|nr:expressed unknown protein [Seminavis robusta]|eukprot:Sro456_g146700.1 n/a (453) ;mRNA; r:44059-45417
MRRSSCSTTSICACGCASCCWKLQQVVVALVLFALIFFSEFTDFENAQDAAANGQKKGHNHNTVHQVTSTTKKKKTHHEKKKKQPQPTNSPPVGEKVPSSESNNNNEQTPVPTTEPTRLPTSASLPTSLRPSASPSSSPSSEPSSYPTAKLKEKAIMTMEPSDSPTSQPSLSPSSTSHDVVLPMVMPTAPKSTIATAATTTTNIIVDDDFIRNCVIQQQKHKPKPFPVVDPPNYRLADCVQKCRKCPTTASADNKNNNNNNNTMACYYASLACPKKKKPKTKTNWTSLFLQDIFPQFETQPGFHKPPSDALVLHLQLGAIIEKSNDDVLSLLLHGNNNIPSVYDLVADIQRANTTAEFIIYVVGRVRWRSQYKKSRVYANCLVQSLQNTQKFATTPPHVVVSTLDDPTTADQDLYFMAHASTLLIPSAGGYSTLAARLVQQLGGTVIERTSL